MARLKTRLDRLETGSPDKSLAMAESELLVSILARRDALFWPHRWQMNDRYPHAEIQRRQREYLAGQIGVAVKADGRADWKNAHALRQSLIAAGYIEANHSSGQVQSVFLTPLGEATSRALVGSRLHTYKTSKLMLAFLMVKAEQTKCDVVRESVLFNIHCVGDPSDWDDWTELMLPLLAYGIVTASGDTQGRIVYRHHADTMAEPEMISVDIEANEHFDDAYLATYESERQSLSTTEPRDLHEITIPLPAGYPWQKDENP